METDSLHGSKIWCFGVFSYTNIPININECVCFVFIFILFDIFLGLVTRNALANMPIHKIARDFWVQ